MQHAIRSYQSEHRVYTLLNPAESPLNRSGGPTRPEPEQCDKTCQHRWVLTCWYLFGSWSIRYPGQREEAKFLQAHMTGHGGGIWKGGDAAL